MAVTARKRTRSRKASYADGALTLALDGLHAAVGTLCNQRPIPKASGSGYHWLDSRYTQLCDGVGGATISGHGRHSASLIPAQIDYLKLKILVDTRTQALNPHPGETPARLHELTQLRYRPQDAEGLDAVANEIVGWVRAVDDLMATKTALSPRPVSALRPHPRLPAV
jgi:hypothetical protein